MSFVSKNPLLLAYAQQEAAGGISRSLRFNSSDSAYCGRTFSTNGTDRKRLSFSFWVKLCDTSATRTVISGYNGSSTQAAYWQFNSGGAFSLTLGGASSFAITTTQVFRDPSAWYHFLISIDTTIASPSSDRIKLYVNGTQVTAFSSSTYPTQNYEVNLLNAGTQTNIGVAWNTGYGGYMNGYLANIHFIDGQALTPSSFTETDATTGQLIPKTYTGSYGTNGFNLLFADNSSNTASTLGKDTSGNGNNWTPNNLSVTAGAGNDSLVDVPTNGAQTDTGVGGEVRGNYAVFNALGGSGTLANGNLEVSSTIYRASTIGVTSGKWYCEFTAGSVVLNSYVGIYGDPNSFGTSYAVWGTGGYFTAGVGSPSNNFSSGSITQGDIIGVAFDCGNGTLAIYRNGSSLGQFSSLTLGGTSWLIGMHTNSSASTPWTVNFGQRPFAYTAPSGFKALNTANLPAPVVTKPSTVFNALLWTGNNTNGRAITGLDFSPDFVWIKNRTNSSENSLFDAVRGAAKTLYSNQTAAELASSAYGHVSSFDTNGFTLSNGSDATYPNLATNYLNSAIVGWCWDAGSSTVTNTQGSITSSVRANATAGFSIVTYEPTSGWTSNANATVGHGLGVKPALIIAKNTERSVYWSVYHSALGAAPWLRLNTTDAAVTTTVWGNPAVEPTSTVFTFGDDASVGYWANEKIVAYCFAPVVGYSSFGSYTGNGSTDGPFVYTGFRPRWLMIKQTNASGNDWYIWDSARESYNLAGKSLQANTSNAEPSIGGPYSATLDILSNGFKPRDSGAGSNGSSSTYIYAAFAESPFNYSRAR